MARLLNSNLHTWRPAPVNNDLGEYYEGDICSDSDIYNDIDSKVDANVIKIVNEKGDTMVFTPLEAKKVLREYIESEFAEFSSEISVPLRDALKTKIESRINKFEKTLEEHLTQKILNVSEKVMNKLTSRHIEAEIERRVNEKLQKIKDAL